MSDKAMDVDDDRRVDDSGLRGDGRVDLGRIQLRHRVRGCT